MSEEASNGWRFFAIFNLSLAAIFFFTVAFFVVWLRYDYITTSSILFTVVLAVLMVALFGDLMKSLFGGDFAGFIGLLLFVVLAMGAVTVGLSLFTAIKPQFISSKFDMVSHFWGVIAWPFVQIGHLISGIVPAMKGLVSWIGHAVGGVADFINPKAFATETVRETISSVLVKAVVFMILLAASLLLPKRFRQTLFARLAATA